MTNDTFVAFIGLGAFGRKRLQVLENVSNIKIAGYYDPYVVNSQLHRFISIGEILQDSRIDIVFICTPNHLHWNLIKLFAHTPKYIFCEKPFAINMNDLEESYQENILFYMGSNLGHFPAMRMARIFIQSFKQEIKSIDFSIGVKNKPEADNWRNKSQLSGGGSLLDNGIHLFYLYFSVFSDINFIDGFCTQNHGVDYSSTIKARIDHIGLSFQTSWQEDLRGYAQVKITLRNNKKYLFLAGDDCVEISDQNQVMTRKIKHITIHSLAREIKFYLANHKDEEFIKRNKRIAQQSLQTILQCWEILADSKRT